MWLVHTCAFVMWINRINQWINRLWLTTFKVLSRCQIDKEHQSAVLLDYSHYIHFNFPNGFHSKCFLAACMFTIQPIKLTFYHHHFYNEAFNCTISKPFIICSLMQRRPSKSALHFAGYRLYVGHVDARSYEPAARRTPVHQQFDCSVSHWTGNWLFNELKLAPHQTRPGRLDDCVYSCWVREVDMFEVQGLIAITITSSSRGGIT